MYADPVWSLLNDAGYLSGALVLALCVLVLVRALATPRVRRGGAACGACDHEITELGGAGGSRCPECGASLLRAGLVTRPMWLRLRGSMALALCAWTVLCLVGTSRAGSYVLMQASRQQMAGGGRMRETVTGDYEPWLSSSDLPLHYVVEVKADAVTNGGATESALVEAAIKIGGKAKATVVHDAAEGGFTVNDAAGAVVALGEAFGKAEAAAAFAAAGLDLENELYQRGAADFAEIVQGVAADPVGYSRSNGSRPLRAGRDECGCRRGRTAVRQRRYHRGSGSPEAGRWWLWGRWGWGCTRWELGGLCGGGGG